MKKYTSSWGVKAVVAGVAFAGFCFAQTNTAVAQSPVMVGGPGAVLKDKVNVRSRPAMTAEVVTQVNKGDSVTVLERKGDWVRVPLPNSAKCYVAARFIQDGIVLADAVNIRCGPGVSFKDVGRLSKDERVQVVETKEGWSQIRPTSHCSGWISAEFIESAAPTLTPAPISTSSQLHTAPATAPVVTPGPAPVGNVSTPVKATSMLTTPMMDMSDTSVSSRHVVKTGFVGEASEPDAPDKYALMTEAVLGRQYIVAYLETAQADLARFVGKPVRIFGVERWKKTDRYPVISVERIDRAL
jgi:SH3-like domain-containing protein